MGELLIAVGQQVSAVRHLPQQFRSDLHLGAQLGQLGGQAARCDEVGQSLNAGLGLLLRGLPLAGDAPQDPG